MPNYDFRCPDCTVEIELFFHVHERKKPTCPRCGHVMVMVFRAMNFISSEFKSIVAFDPVKKHDVKTHGGHFDLGAGRYFADKNERARWMRETGHREMDRAKTEKLLKEGKQREEDTRHAHSPQG